jgi:hypothetical protein
MVLAVRQGAGIHDGAGGQHRSRKIRCAEQGAPHFLQHDALIAKAEPVAAIGFGNADRRQAERGVDRVPAVAFVAMIGFHQSPHFLRRRTVCQQAPQVGAELFLLARKTELYGVLPPALGLDAGGSYRPLPVEMALFTPNFLTCSLWAVNTVIAEEARGDGHHPRKLTRRCRKSSQPRLCQVWVVSHFGL